MKAGRHNIPLDTTPGAGQCPARLTLKDDGGEDIITLPCMLPVHPPLGGHKFVIEWNDVFSDKPLLPDPPNVRVISETPERNQP